MVTTLYTVPAGNVAVIRDMEYFSSSSALFNVQCSSSGRSGLLWYLSGVPANSWHQWQGNTVLPPGDVLQGFADGAGNLIVVSGFLLTLP